MKKPVDLSKSDRKLAVLIDPDKHSESGLVDFISVVDALKADLVLLGGSLVKHQQTGRFAKILKSLISQPVVLFPGHFTQLTDEVDAVLLLSLISGRNADLLIGQHVLAAPTLVQMEADIISTGYMLIEGGNSTSVAYMSNSMPIPRKKTEIAVCTAQAGELIGMKCIYLDAGSGATLSIPLEMVRAVSDSVSLPVIVGGGIRNLEHVVALHEAGANLVVVGNALEDNSFKFSKDEALEKALDA